MWHLMVLLAAAPLLVGCAVEGMDPGDDGDLGEAEAAEVASNNLDPNNLDPNNLDPNNLDPNALDPGTLVPAALDPATMASDALTALQLPSDVGRRSREFLRYAVGCAFDRDHWFTFSWTDAEGVEHDEAYRGSLGLATEWQTGPLSADGQHWVSACLAAKANHYNVSVLISLRNGVASPALAADSAEQIAYPYREGAFWGNLFKPSPELYSCSFEPTAAHSRGKKRVCAAGYIEGGQVQFCRNIQNVGSCASSCVQGGDPSRGYASCGGSTKVITVSLD